MTARIRWANLARLFAVLAVLALVVAWPRMGPPEVALPPETAVPVASAAPEEFAPEPPVATPRPRRSAPARRPVKRRRTARVRRGRAPAAVVSPAADPVTPPIRRVYRPRPLPEFGVE